METHSTPRERTTRPGRIRQQLRWWRFALAGLVSAALLFGVAELVAAFFSTTSSPLVALGQTFIDITPAWLKDFAIGLFGTNDKLALFVSMGIVAALVAAGTGLLARTRPAAASGVIVLLGVGMSASVLSRPASGVLDIVPTVVGTITGILALRYLAHLAATATADATVTGDPDSPAADGRVTGGPVATGRTVTPASRRGFLLGSLVGAVGAAALLAGGRALSAIRNTAETTREALKLPSPVKKAKPLPQGVASDVKGMPAFVTPNSQFYRIDTALAVPRVDPASWSLRVHGMVDEEFTIGFDELLGMDLEETWLTLTCVSNPVGGDLVGNAKWLGYPLRKVLERARPQAGADMVLSTSIDGFSASTPLEVLTDERNALLAVGMNGEPLPLEHGYPVRMVVPGLYGYVSATKWVVDLEVTRFADKTGYWTTRGWSDHGPIKLSSRVDVPRPFATVAPGTVMLGGTAWAQTTGIKAVQVKIDDGDWQAADLAAEATVDTWRQWSYAWKNAQPGTHSVTVRAIDAEGTVQTAERANPAPNGSSGLQRLQFTVG